jgi:hypothetical protein
LRPYSNGFCPQCRGELRSPKRYIIKAQVPNACAASVERYSFTQLRLTFSERSSFESCNSLRCCSSCSIFKPNCATSCLTLAVVLSQSSAPIPSINPRCFLSMPLIPFFFIGVTTNAGLASIRAWMSVMDLEIWYYYNNLMGVTGACCRHLR